jgi:hypothetical protein
MREEYGLNPVLHGRVVKKGGMSFDSWHDPSLKMGVAGSSIVSACNNTALQKWLDSYAGINQIRFNGTHI